MVEWSRMTFLTYLDLGCLGLSAWSLSSRRLTWVSLQGRCSVPSNKGNIFLVSAYIPCANILLAKVSHMAKLKEWTPTLDGQGATKSPNKETYTHNEKNLWPFFFFYSLLKSMPWLQIIHFLPPVKYTFTQSKTLKTLMPIVVSVEAVNF